MKTLNILAVIVSLWVGLSFAAEDGKQLDALDTMWAKTDNTMTVEQSVRMFGMDNSIHVLAKDVIEITWWNDDYKKCFLIVFYEGHAISKRLCRITNEPALKEKPHNLGPSASD